MLLRDPYQAQELNQRHVNAKYLPDWRLPRNIRATTAAREAIEGAQYAVHAVPVQQTRSFLQSIKVCFWWRGGLAWLAACVAACMAACKDGKGRRRKRGGMPSRAPVACARRVPRFHGCHCKPRTPRPPTLNSSAKTPIRSRCCHRRCP